VERLAGWRTVELLNRPNLDDAMAVQRVEASYLGVDDDFTHGGAVPPPSAGLQCIYGNNSSPIAVDERKSP
jgi:hypothetical protein